jgi:hypothetical protein
MTDISCPPPWNCEPWQRSIIYYNGNLEFTRQAIPKASYLRTYDTGEIIWIGIAKGVYPQPDGSLIVITPKGADVPEGAVGRNSGDTIHNSRC